MGIYRFSGFGFALIAYRGINKPDMTKKQVQRLKNFRVTKVAILDVPSAVGAQGVYKAAEGSDMVLLKAMTKYVEVDGEERGLLYSLVFVPDRVDKHGHWATARDIEEACHSWGAEGCPMNFNHGPEFGKNIGGRDITKEEAVVVENTVVQPGDRRFDGITIDGEEVNTAYGWGVVIKLLSEDMRKAAREKKLNELSLESPRGSYELVTEEPPKEEELSMSDISKLEGRIGGLETKLVNLASGMETLTKALEASVPKPQTPEQKEIAELKEKLAKLEQKPEDKPEDKPEVVDLTDPEALKKLERDLEIKALREGKDLAKAEDLKKYRQELETLKKRYEKEDAPNQKEGKSGDGIQKSEDDDGTPGAPAGLPAVDDLVKSINARRGYVQKTA